MSSPSSAVTGRASWVEQHPENRSAVATKSIGGSDQNAVRFSSNCCLSVAALQRFENAARARASTRFTRRIRGSGENCRELTRYRFSGKQINFRWLLKFLVIQKWHRLTNINRSIDVR